METQIARTVTYAQIRKFTKNLFLRNTGFLVTIHFSCVRESQQSIYHSKKTIISQFMAFFCFEPVITNMKISSKAPQKDKILSLYLPKLNWQYGISKMVSLSIRRLRIKFMWVFLFWADKFKYKNCAPFLQKG